jgi:hypothetical protein
MTNFNTISSETKLFASLPKITSYKSLSSIRLCPCYHIPDINTEVSISESMINEVLKSPGEDEKTHNSL